MSCRQYVDHPILAYLLDFDASATSSTLYSKDIFYVVYAYQYIQINSTLLKFINHLFTFCILYFGGDLGI